MQILDTALPCTSHLKPIHSRQFLLSSGRLHCFFHYTTIKEMNGSIGMFGITRVVGHDADRGASSMKVTQQVHDRFTVPRVEVSGRLVCQ